ncbi:unnamed protein product [Mytilus edulis]|uniref:Uncharacterized protein n=1 Tax=Mytilus edulis TaxID=6550 RepID=A0A8S3UES8_MYTED|nr:unnamed protein product [Mytilus edulis]
MIFFGKGFHYLKKLKSLELRNNFRCALSKYTFKNTKYLQNVLLHGIGEISFRKGTFGKLRYLKHLEMSFDSEKGGIVSPVENIAEDFIHTSIETLKLGQSAIPLNTFPLYILNKEMYKNNITEICLTDNAGNAGHFPIPMGAPPRSLQILNLSNNSLARFKLDIKNITDLILRQNLLGDFLSTKSYFEKKTDEYFSVIEIIDISQNDIKELAPFTFDSQPFLKHIDLSNNKIQDITFDLSGLLALDFLNLSNNRIKFLMKPLCILLIH